MSNSVQTALSLLAYSDSCGDSKSRGGEGAIMLRRQIDLMHNIWRHLGATRKPATILKCHRSCWLAPLRVMVLVLSPVTAYSQEAPSRVTPGTLRPAMSDTAGGILLPDTGGLAGAAWGGGSERDPRQSRDRGRLSRVRDGDTRARASASRRIESPSLRSMSSRTRWNKCMRAPAMSSSGSRCRRRS